MLSSNQSGKNRKEVVDRDGLELYFEGVRQLDLVMGCFNGSVPNKKGQPCGWPQSETVGMRWLGLT